MNMSSVNTVQQQQLQLQPSLTILEEPMPRVRFRYASEGGCAGNIYGVNNTGEHQTFPTVMVSSAYNACNVIDANPYTSRWDINFVFFQKSITVLKKNRFFRLSNLVSLSCYAVKRAAHHAVGRNHVTYGNSHFTPPIHLPFCWCLAV